MNKAIRFEKISKQYRLGTISTGTLSHDLNRWWYKIRGKGDPYLQIGQENVRSEKAESDYVWALKDISFDVEEGDVLGIIGKNGAGKSTLLKILSKITRPTTGVITGRGRIASLLEVGTGFHAEMTGRENIYMNGAIMGMTKREISAKLDEIIDFAGVERYIDTPSKRYSSGMVVRLGFAIAAHLEPEILVIDEVLAVGDSEFQKKAIGKMQDVSRGKGRTVLFVSHNMGSIRQLCTKGVVLKNGLVDFMGTQVEAINHYQSSYNSSSFFEHKGTLAESPGNDYIRLISFFVRPIQGEILTIASGLEYEMTFYNFRKNTNLDVIFELRTLDDQIVFHNSQIINTKKDSQEGYYTVVGRINPNLLNSGNYKFNLIFYEDRFAFLHYVLDVVEFEIINETEDLDLRVLPGVLRIPIPYEVSFSKTR